MAQSKIIFDISGKTAPGGEKMEVTEIQMGDATYQLSRIFVGSRTVSELLVDAVVDRARAEIAVDASEKPAV